MEKLSSPIDLVKKSFTIFFDKENLTYFLKIYVWLVPFHIFFLYQNYFINSEAKTLNTENAYEIVFKNPWFLASIVLVNLIFVVVSFLVDIAGIKAISTLSSGNSKSVNEVFKFAKKIAWQFAMLSILIGLIQLGGLILLIIPVIIFSTWYEFAKFVFVIEGAGIKNSLKASKKLVDGRFWAVLGRIIVFSIFILIFQVIFAAIPFNIGSLIVPLFGALFVLPFYLLYRELSE